MATSSARRPKTSASVGQEAAQAGSAPVPLARSVQNSHLRTAGLERLVEFVGRDLEGTGHLAVPAPDADGGIVDHGPVGGLGQRAHDAGRNAGGVEAVHALDLAVGLGQAGLIRGWAPGELVHDGEGGFGGPTEGAEDVPVRKGLGRAGKMVPAVAGLLALPAPDAERGIHQDAHIVPEGVAFSSAAREDAGNSCRGCKPHFREGTPVELLDHDQLLGEPATTVQCEFG